MALSSLLPEDFERQLHCTTGAYTLNTSNFLFWIWRFNPLPPKHLHISYITCNVTAQSFFFFFFLSIQKVEHRQKFEERRNCFLVFSQTAVCFIPPLPPPPKKKHTINRLNIYFFFIYDLPNVLFTCWHLVDLVPYLPKLYFNLINLQFHMTLGHPGVLGQSCGS